MVYVRYLYPYRYILNIRSTNHSPKEKQTIARGFMTQLLFWSVEILLRVYIVYYQYGYILIYYWCDKNRVSLEIIK